jgi:hypothetical protein
MAVAEHPSTKPSLKTQVHSCDRVVALSTFHMTAKAHHQSCHSGAPRIPTATTAHALNLCVVSLSSFRMKDPLPHATSDAGPSSHPTKALIPLAVPPSLCRHRPLLKHKQSLNANPYHHRVRPTPSPRFSREQTCIEIPAYSFRFSCAYSKHWVLYIACCITGVFPFASINDVRAL